MLRNTGGFTLIELMIVVVIIGILAALAIPNFATLQANAKEGSTKANMHTFQVSAEDWAARNDGVYANNADSIGTYTQTGFKNPFNGNVGPGGAWQNTQADAAGIVGYEGSGSGYTITGGDRHGNTMTLTLTNGS